MLDVFVPIDAMKAFWQFIWLQGMKLVHPVTLALTDPPYRHAHMDGGGFAAARQFYAGGAFDGIERFRPSRITGLS